MLPGDVKTVHGPELHLDASTSTLQKPLLHLDVFPQQGPELHLDVSTLQRPVLHMDYTAEACAAHGGVYTTAHGPELDMDNRSL